MTNNNTINGESIITRAYGTHSNGLPNYEQYPSKVEWDGQMKGMLYMDIFLNNLTELMVKAYQTNDMELIGDLIEPLEETFNNIAWHSDGEPSWDGKYLMEAFMVRNGNQPLEDIKAIHKKTYPE